MTDEGTELVGNPIDALQAENLAAFEELKAEGGEVPNEFLLALRIETLLDTLLPDGHPFRQAYDFTYELKLSQVLQGAASAVRKAKLTEGV